LRIKITFKGHELRAQLAQNSTARSVFEGLPVESSANRWGEEVYFNCPAEPVEEDMKQVMAVGDIGYWIEGRSLAIFFGPTPASTDDRPKAAVPVVLVGRIERNIELLREVGDGDAIALEAQD
jgi:hypothetical protein